MATFQQKQMSSRPGRSIVTAITTGTTQVTAAISANVYQVRLSSTLPVWITFGSSSATEFVDAYLPANVTDYITVTPGQVFSFASTSTSSGYVSLTEMS